MPQEQGAKSRRARSSSQSSSTLKPLSQQLCTLRIEAAGNGLCDHRSRVLPELQPEGFLRFFSAVLIATARLCSVNTGLGKKKKYSQEGLSAVETYTQKKKTELDLSKCNFHLHFQT